VKKIILIVLAIVCVCCNGPAKSDVVLDGPKVDKIRIELYSRNIDSLLEYHTGHVIFYLPKKEVVRYCKTPNSYPATRASLLAYVNADLSTTRSYCDRFIDTSAPGVAENYFLLDDVIQWATVSILKSGYGRVFDKKTMRFADFVNILNSNGKYCGFNEIRLPNDSLAMRVLRWVR
jgi:hypothetical protein